MERSLNVRVGHVSLEVSDLIESKKFYEPALTNLGFNVIFDDENAIGMANGLLSIWLARPDSRRVERKTPTGDEFAIADHIALYVPDRENVDKVTRVLRDAGFKPLFPPEEHQEFQPGYYSASFTDRDNNVVEFYTIESQSG